MNYTKFVQTGGFPLKAERLQELQTAYSIFNALGNIAGNFTIIDGCQMDGNTVSDGVVFVNGEVYNFRSSYLNDDSKVVILEETTPKTFENGESKNVHFLKYATFGTSEISFPWSDFKRPIETKAIPTDLVARLEALEARPIFEIPIGLIAIWERPANQIPAGWIEYVELRGKTPVGNLPGDTDFNPLGKEGGSKNAVVVSHSHTITNSGNINNGGGTAVPGKTARWDGGAGTHLNGTVSTVGESGLGKNLQPYRIVHFIKYVG